METIDTTDQPLDQRSIRAERKRIGDIQAFEKRVGGEFVRQHVEAGTSIETVRAEALARIMAADDATPTSSIRGGTGDTYDNPSFLGEAIADALAARFSGDRLPLPEKSRAFRGKTLVELAGTCLERDGVSTRDLSKHEVLQRAFSTRANYAFHGVADFPMALQAGSERTIMGMYAEFPSNLRRIVRVGTHPDFRPHKYGRLGALGDLKPKPEFAEIEGTTIAEGSFEEMKLETKAGAFGLSREAMANDDTGMLTASMNSFALSVRQAEDDAIWAVIQGTPVMADGLPLIDAGGHANSVTPVAFGTAALDVMRRTMRLQRGIDSTRALNIQPAILLTGVHLETTAGTILSPINATEAVNAHPFAGRLELIVEPRIDDTYGAAAGEHYLFSDPATFPSIMLVLREGFQGPQVESWYDHGTRGFNISVVHDFTAGALDYRGAVFNAGG